MSAHGRQFSMPLDTLPRANLLYGATRPPIPFYRQIEGANPHKTASALAIGSFKSLHLGHKALIDTLVRLAKPKKLHTQVMHFHPTPYEYLCGRKLPLLMDNLTRRLLLSAWGVDSIIAQKCDKDFLAITARDFVEKILIASLNVKLLVIGDDFRFGHKRQGDYELLQEYRQQIEVVRLPTVPYAQKRISTTWLEKVLQEQEFDQVLALLGRPWVLTGRVQSGDGKGAQHGFPTLNFPISSRYLCPLGVYAAWVEIPELGLCQAAVNIGTRPTIHKTSPLILEAFILDKTFHLQKEKIVVHLVKRIRPERAFADAQALYQQIAQDIKEINQHFASLA